jgi:hypothetical protein
MIKIKLIPIIFIFSLVLYGCKDFFEIRPTDDFSKEEIFGRIDKAQQYIGYSYSQLSRDPWFDLEYYTDNAVSNDKPLTNAVAGWNPESFPVSGEWDKGFRNIIRLNDFLENGFKVPYDVYKLDYSNRLKSRIRGEAFGLRAWYEWILLKNFAGPSASDPNIMLGFPIMDGITDISKSNEIPRSTYADCFKRINADIDSAYQYINILRYNGTTTGIDDKQNVGRISNEMLLALKARMYLFAASPAYKIVTWDDAAKVAYNAIALIDNKTIKTLAAFGDYNDPASLDDFWRSSYTTNGNREGTYYPPSMNGTGDCNPTQNLVDAFPTATGYPIDHLSGGYDQTKPYTNRDLRFYRFIFYNGINSFRNANVQTYNGGSDMPGGINLFATRTGYYMKRFLSSQVDKTPQTTGKTTDYKYYAFFTRTGLYLDFAEAATEAYGIAGKDLTMSISAKDALVAIRKRAGVVTDNYLAEALTDKSKLIQLVKNERRLEFCFEGERFYDIQRWMLPLAQLNSPITGISIEKGVNGVFSYANKTVEKHLWTSTMYYNPIPRNEVLKSKTIIQNNGWQ